MRAAEPVRQGPGEMVTTSATAGSHSRVTSSAPASASSAGPLSVMRRALARGRAPAFSISRPRTSGCGPPVSTKLDEAGAAFPPERGDFGGDGAGVGVGAVDGGLNGSFGPDPWNERRPGVGTVGGTGFVGATGREAGGSEGGSNGVAGACGDSSRTLRPEKLTLFSVPTQTGTRSSSSICGARVMCGVSVRKMSFRSPSRLRLRRRAGR